MSTDFQPDMRGAAENDARPWQNKEVMVELYHEKRLSMQEMADHLGCHHQTIIRWMEEHGIETRGQSEAFRLAKRKKPPCHRFTRRGYECVETTIDGSTHQVRVHRLVMVAEHGIDAAKDMHVHHKNGVPWDNRPSNLELMTPSEHTEHHRPIDERWER